MRLSGLFALLLLLVFSPLRLLADSFLVPQLGHAAAVNHLQYSPDGQFLVSASDDASLRVWDGRGNLVSVLEGHGASLVQSLFIQDQTLISLARNGELFAWHSIGETRLSLLGFDDNLPVTGHQIMDYNPRSEILAVAGYKSLQWSPVNISLLREQKPLPVKRLALPFKVKALALSPSGKLAAVVSDEGWLALVDLDSGKLLRKKQLNQPWQSLAFRTDQQLVLAGNNISLLDVEKMTLGRQIEVSGFWGIFALALSPDATQVAALASEAVVINLDTGETRARLPNMHSAGLAFHPKGEQLALVYQESPRCFAREASIGVFSLDGQKLTDFLAGPNALTTADLSSNNLLAINRCDRDIQLWDINTLSRKALLHSPDGALAALTFSEDGNTLYTRNYQGQVRRWNLTDGSSELIAQGESESLTRLLDKSQDKSKNEKKVYSHSGALMVEIDYKDLVIYDGKDNSLIQKIGGLNPQRLFFTQDDKRLLVISADGQVKLLDTSAKFALTKGIQTLVSNPKGNPGYAVDYQTQQVIWRDESLAQPVFIKEISDGQMRWHRFSAKPAIPPPPATAP